MSPCVNWNARSPEIVERSTVATGRARAARSSACGRRRRSRRGASSAPRQNTRPIDARRAAAAASGRGGEQVDPRRDQRLDAVGDPVERGAVAVARPACAQSPRGRAGCPRPSRAASARWPAVPSAAGSSASASSRLSSASSGPSSIDAARGLPPPQVGRGVEQVEPRDADDQHRRVAAARARGARRPRAGAPRPTGCPRTRARAAARRRAARPSAALPRSISAASPRPRRRRGRRARRRAGRRPPRSRSRARSFSNASAAGSSSVIPADALIIEASGQYVMPSPYGSARPVSTVTRSTPSANSETSRDLPTPGSPKTVDEVRAAVAERAVVRVVEQLELVLAADERRLRPALARVERRGSRARTRSARPA